MSARILAGALAKAGGDHGEVFRRYEAAVRPFAEKNQALAPGHLKGMVLGSRAQIWMQTRMVGVLPHLPGGRRILRRVADGIHRAATAITLDDGPLPCVEP